MTFEHGIHSSNYQIARGNVPLVEEGHPSVPGFIKVGIVEGTFQHAIRPSFVETDFDTGISYREDIDPGDINPKGDFAWRWINIDVELTRVDGSGYSGGSSMLDERHKKARGSKHVRGENPVEFFGSMILQDSVVIECDGRLFRSGFYRGALNVRKKNTKSLEEYIRSK